MLLRLLLRQAHKFGSPFGQSVARKAEGGVASKALAQNGFFFPSLATSTAFPAAGLGLGLGRSRDERQQFRCGNHWPEAGDGIFLGPNRMLRLFTP